MTIPIQSLEATAELIQAVKALAIDWGLTTSPQNAGDNIISDSTKAWAADMHRNRLLKIIAGGGAGQQGILAGNTVSGLRIQGAWTVAIGTGALYAIIGIDVAQAVRDVLGGGADISATNPLPVDTSAGSKTTTQIMTLANLAAGATSVIGDCNSLDLRSGPHDLALTVVATYNAAATLGLRVHTRTSPDDTNWDSEDWDMWTAGFTAGVTIRETVNYETDPMYLRVLIENLDAAQAITNIAVIASVGA